MTDNEIIKALECCLKKLCHCRKCPRFEKGTDDCHETLYNDVLDLLNRQQAEIERLNDIRAELSKEIERLRGLVEECVDSNEAWVRDNGELRNELKTAKAVPIKELEAEIERLNTILDAYALQYGTVKGVSECQSVTIAEETLTAL